MRVLIIATAAIGLASVTAQALSDSGVEVVKVSECGRDTKPDVSLSEVPEFFLKHGSIDETAAVASPLRGDTLSTPHCRKDLCVTGNTLRAYRHSERP